MAGQSRRSLWTAKIKGGKTDAVALGSWGKRVPCDGIVLGIDPSLRGTGLALIEFRPQQPAQLLFSDTVKVHPRASMTECLGFIAQAVYDVMERWQVEAAAIEQTIYVQNFQTAQILGAARGAAIAPLSMRKIPVHEYAPLRIKQATVGFGRASKEQVAGMIKSELRLTVALPADESDAAAVAFCHAMNLRDKRVN